MSAPAGGTSSTWEASHSSSCAGASVEATIAAAATRAKNATFRCFILRGLSGNETMPALLQKQCISGLDIRLVRAPFSIGKTILLNAVNGVKRLPAGEVCFPAL